MAPRIPKTVLSIGTLVLLGMLIYALPFIGKLARAVHVRAGAFLFNVYHAQESGKRYQELSQELAKTYQQSAAIVQLEQENDVLRKELGIGKRELNEHLILASIIGQGSSFGRQTLIINKGINDGLAGGEPVITSPNMLIGVVGNLFSRYAIVSLVTSNNFALPAQTQSGIKGVIKGSPGGQVIFDEVSQTMPLSQNDILVTTNQNPTIPGNMMIGRVQKIISQPTDIVKKAEVQVFFNPDLLQKVFIIKTP